MSALPPNGEQPPQEQKHDARLTIDYMVPFGIRIKTENLNPMIVAYMLSEAAKLMQQIFAGEQKRVIPVGRMPGG